MKKILLLLGALIYVIALAISMWFVSNLLTSLMMGLSLTFMIVFWLFGTGLFAAIGTVGISAAMIPVNSMVSKTYKVAKIFPILPVVFFGLYSVIGVWRFGDAPFSDSQLIMAIYLSFAYAGMFFAMGIAVFEEN
jgi:hypothetical protein